MTVCAARPEPPRHPTRSGVGKRRMLGAGLVRGWCGAGALGVGFGAGLVRGWCRADVANGYHAAPRSHAATLTLLCP